MLCKCLTKQRRGTHLASGVSRMAATHRALHSKRRISERVPAGVPTQAPNSEPRNTALTAAHLSMGEIIYTYPGTLICARLIKRFKRFLADVEVRCILNLLFFIKVRFMQ